MGKPSKKQPERTTRRYIAQARTLPQVLPQFADCVTVVLHQTILFNDHETNGRLTKINYHLTRTSWATNSRLATQESRNILCNPKFHYHVHKNPPPFPILRPINPLHTPHCISLRSILILSSHLRLSRPSVLFPFVFPTKHFTAVLLAHIVLHALTISLSLNSLF
jgi:hypothetical protein